MSALRPVSSTFSTSGEGPTPADDNAMGKDTSNLESFPGRFKFRNGSRKGRYFGVPKSSARASTTDPYNYEERFPEDTYGEEMGANARVWRTYLEQSAKADAEMVESWNETTDVLLIFAGLFSAVVTTFVVQLFPSLLPNTSAITVSLLEEQIRLQRAVAEGITISAVPASPLSSSSPFTAASLDLWVNGLWFVSLTFSLGTALISVLVKQWIQRYIAVVSGSAREQVHIRHFRYMGLERWRVPSIIGWLPILLHFALLLFFVGLILFLTSLNTIITVIVGVLAGSSFVMYFVTTLLPLRYPQCPYGTALTAQLLSAHRVLSTLPYIFHSCFSTSTSSNVSAGSRSPTTAEMLRVQELDVIRRSSDELDAQALVWLYKISSNPTITSIVVQALSGLRPGFAMKDILTSVRLDSAVLDTLRGYLRGYTGKDGDHPPIDHGMLSKIERVARAREVLPTWSVGRVDEQFPAIIVQLGIEVEDPRLVAIGRGSNINQRYSEADAQALRKFIDDTVLDDLELSPSTWETLFLRAKIYAVISSRSLWHWDHLYSLLCRLPCHLFFFSYSPSLPRPKDHRTTNRDPSTTAFNLSTPDIRTSREIVHYLHCLMCSSCSLSLHPLPTGSQDVDIHFMHVISSALRYLQGIFDDAPRGVDVDDMLSVILSRFLAFIFAYLPYLFATSSSVSRAEWADPRHQDAFKSASADIRVVIQSFMESGDLHLSDRSHWYLLEAFHILFTDSYFHPFSKHTQTSSPSYALASIPALTCTPAFMMRLLWFADTRYPPDISTTNADKYTFAYTSNPSAARRRVYKIIGMLFSSGSSSTYQCFQAHDGLRRVLALRHTCQGSWDISIQIWILCQFLEGIRVLSDGDDGGMGAQMVYFHQRDVLKKFFILCTMGNETPVGGRCKPSLTDADRSIVMNFLQNFRNHRSPRSMLSRENLSSSKKDDVLLDVVRDIVGLTRDHARFQYKWRVRNDECSCAGYADGFTFLGEVVSLITDSRAIGSAELNTLQNDAEEEFLKLFEYVSGSEIAIIPYNLSHLHGRTIYAPYAVPFIPVALKQRRLAPDALTSVPPLCTEKKGDVFMPPGLSLRYGSKQPVPKEKP